MSVHTYKHNSSTTYALGATIVYELLKTSPSLVVQIFVSPQLKTSQDTDFIFDKCTELNIPVITSNKPFNILSPKGNCYIIAEFTKPQQCKLNSAKNHLILVNPSDAGNIGTIIRTAVGLGATELAIISPAVDVYDPKSIRATMGAIFHINIAYYDSFEKYTKDFPTHHRYAFMLSSKQPVELPNLSPAYPYSLFFGNEASGLPKVYEQTCTPVFIPQSPDIDSFSLPISVAMSLYSVTFSTKTSKSVLL